MKIHCCPFFFFCFLFIFQEKKIEESEKELIETKEEIEKITKEHGEEMKKSQQYEQQKV